MTPRPPRAARFFLALLFPIIWSSGAAARTSTIDDTGTQALEPTVALHWKQATPRRGTSATEMVGRSVLRVHLNLAPWLKRHGRIYLNLPAQPPGPLRLRWTTQGRLAAGELRSGNRVLLYAGPITSPVLEDVLTLEYSLDGAQVRRDFPISFHFEMDED